MLREPLCPREAVFDQISAVGSAHTWADGGYHLANLFQLSLIFQRSLILNTETQQLWGYANLIWECVPAGTKRALIYHLFPWAFCSLPATAQVDRFLEDRVFWMDYIPCDVLDFFTSLICSGATQEQLSLANHGRQDNQEAWKWKSELNAFLFSELTLNEYLKCFDRKRSQTFIYFFFFSLMVTAKNYYSYFHDQARDAVSVSEASCLFCSVGFLSSSFAGISSLMCLLVHISSQLFNLCLS